MNCEEITQKINEVTALRQEIKDANGDDLNENIDTYLEKRKRIKEIFFEIESDLNQYEEREKVAKKLDFFSAYKLSGGAFVGEKEFPRSTENYLVDRDGDRILAGPFRTISDAGNGNCLVYENIKEPDQSLNMKILDSEGNIIIDLSKKRITQCTRSHFDNSQPLYMASESSDNDSDVEFHLRPDGKMILFNIKDRRTSRWSEFKDNRIWIRGDNKVFVQYDIDGNEIARCKDELIEIIQSLDNGRALALRVIPIPNNTSMNEVFIVDSEGNALTTHVYAKGIPNLKGDILEAKDINEESCYYLFEDNLPENPRILNIPNQEYTGIDFNTVDKIIIYQSADNLYNIVNYDGVPIVDMEFKFAGSFSDGLAPVELTNGKWCFIDKEGHFLNPQVKGITGLGQFNDRYALGIDNKGRFLINHRGEDSFNGKRFNVLEPSGKGTYFVWEMDNNDACYYVKTNGERIF